MLWTPKTTSSQGALSRTVHVLRRMTSAWAGSSVGSKPMAARRPAMASESRTFIWHPCVIMWKRRGSPDTVAHPRTRSDRRSAYHTPGGRAKVPLTPPGLVPRNPLSRRSPCHPHDLSPPSVGILGTAILCPARGRSASGPEPRAGGLGGPAGQAGALDAAPRVSRAVAPPADPARSGLSGRTHETRSWDPPTGAPAGAIGHLHQYG